MKAISRSCPLDNQLPKNGIYHGQIAINIGFQFVYNVGEYDTAVDRGNVYTVCDL